MNLILFALALLALKACGVPEFDLLPIRAFDSRITLRDPHIFGLVEGEFRSALAFSAGSSCTVGSGTVGAFTAFRWRGSDTPIY